MNELTKFLLYAAIGGAIVFLLMHKGCKPDDRPDTIPATTLQKEVEKKTAPLLQQIAQLEQEKAQSKKVTADLQSKDSTLRFQLYAARNQRPATRTLIRYLPAPGQDDTDTIPPGDTTTVWHDVTDSLCDEVIKNLDSITANQNRTIAIQEKQLTAKDSVISVFRSGFDTATTSLKRWETYGKQLEKVVKRQSTGKKIAMILLGIAAGKIAYDQFKK